MADLELYIVFSRSTQTFNLECFENPETTKNRDEKTTTKMMLFQCPLRFTQTMVLCTEIMLIHKHTDLRISFLISFVLM